MLTRAMKITRPIYAQGKIIKGFGRGSKELGIPTANFPDEVVSGLPPEIDTGVYLGWAKVDDGLVHKMVMSIGWNPYYKNEKKSMETHILHNFGRDLYGCLLKVVICGYIRPEKDFKSLEALIEEIQSDISFAKETLEKEEMKTYQSDPFFDNDQKSHHNGHNGDSSPSSNSTDNER